MFSDFFVIYQWGVDLLGGRYVSLYPLPANIIFSLLALLPREIALGIVLFLSLVVLVVLFKHKAILWAFYWPILQVFFMGQIDILFLGLYALDTPLSLALMTLKPQLFILALPKIFESRSKFKRFSFYTLLLWGIPSAFRPGWFLEWLHNMDDGRIGHNTSASVWGIPGLFFLTIAIIIIGKFDWKSIGLVLNPGVRPYDYTFLAGKTLWLIPLSYIVGYLCNAVQKDWPTIILGLFVLILGRLQLLKTQKSNRGVVEQYG